MTRVHTIHDLTVSDRVTFIGFSSQDRMNGTVTEVDYANIKVLWDDQTTSIYAKKDGFVSFGVLHEGSR